MNDDADILKHEKEVDIEKPGTSKWTTKQSMKKEGEMNTMTSFMTTLVLGFGLTLAGCATSESMHDESFQGPDHENSVDFHMEAIERNTAKMAIMEEKIQKLQKRITMFNQKPYRDPKGFRRSGWKLLMGNWRQELNDLKERIAWHTNKIERLQALAIEHSAVFGEWIGKSKVVRSTNPIVEHKLLTIYKHEG